jgi:hypothetical protein
MLTDEIVQVNTKSSKNPAEGSPSGEAQLALNAQAY